MKEKLKLATAYSSKIQILYILNLTPESRKKEKKEKKQLNILNILST